MLTCSWQIFTALHPAVKQIYLVDVVTLLVALVGLLSVTNKSSFKVLVPCILFPPIFWLFAFYSIGTKITVHSKLSNVLFLLIGFIFAAILLLMQLSFGSISNFFPEDVLGMRWCMLFLVPGVLLCMRRIAVKRQIAYWGTLFLVISVTVVDIAIISNAYILYCGQWEAIHAAKVFALSQYKKQGRTVSRMELEHAEVGRWETSQAVNGTATFTIAVGQATELVKVTWERTGDEFETKVQSTVTQAQ